MNTLLISLFILLQSQVQVSADSISLKYCYERAAEEYPVSEKMEIQQKMTELNVQIANTGYFPQVSLSGKASYQSEVTEFGLPGGGGPPPVSKDQYEAAIQVNQNIYNGGVTGIRKDLERSKGEQEILNTKIELQQIRAQIDEVYFGILLSQQQNKTIGLFVQDLQKRLNNVRSKVENGVLLRSQLLILEAELIKARQDSSSMMANIKAGYAVLGKLIGEVIPETTELTLPEPFVEIGEVQPQRPELALFKSSSETIERQKRLAQTQKLPRLSAFGTAAYGRPGLNFLDDNFHDYYMVGLRLNWNFMDFLNSDEEVKILSFRQKQIQKNEEAFNLQLNAQLTRIEERMAAIQENIIRDKEIIKIQEQVVAESASQLENGVITSTEYVTILTNVSRARLSLFTNRIKFIQAQAEYRTALGLDIE